MTTNVSDILELLIAGKNLTDLQADMVFDELLEGRLGPAQAGAFLMGLRIKGEDSTDLAAGVRAGIKHATPIPGVSDVQPYPTIDTCGTGGDSQHSFNCSTAVALFLADMGHKVVKHGNRAVSSSSGSADVLEALGVDIQVPADKAAEILERDNFIFMFAPAYHPAFKHIVPVRKELGIRTLFNLLGPLINPARPSHQLLGVGDPERLFIMSETLLLMGIEKALVIHGAGGFDELTPFGPARGYLIENGRMEKTVINPDRLGFGTFAPQDVRVSDAGEAHSVMRRILAGDGPEAMMQMVALNLAACVHLLTDRDLKECAEEARTRVNQGLTRGLPGA